MSASNFLPCLKVSLRWEGGYVDHPKDPGGATNYGITRATLAAHRGRAVSKREVRNLRVEEAGEIYRSKYWDKIKGDHLPDGLDLVTFDGGINSGPSRGIRWLQKGLGVVADGRVGPLTLKAARTAPDGVAVIQRACAARLGFLRGLRTWSTFGRGWGRRVAAVEVEAVAMRVKNPARVAREAPKAARAAEQHTGAAGSAGAGGGVAFLADLPDFVSIGVLGVSVVLAVLFATRAAHHRRRAAAYRAKSKEMFDG